MVYGKTILAVITGLFLFIFGSFVATIGFVNRLSAQVGIGLKADHLTYVTLGLCIIAIGVILLLYGCRLYYKIWRNDNQKERFYKEMNSDGTSDNLTDVHSVDC